MDLAKILVEARTAIEDAGVPEDLREVAFSKAVDVLTMRHGSVAPPGAGSAGVAPAGAGSQPSASAAIPPEDGSPKRPANAVAKRLNIEHDVVGEIIFFNDDGQVEILVTTNSLDSTNAGATRELALLVAGSRQLSGLEEWTSVDTIREVCEHFGRYDKDNFAATIRRLDAYFSIRGGSRNRSLKLRKPGQEELKSLFERLAGARSG